MQLFSTQLLKLQHLASVLSVGERSKDTTSCSVAIFIILLVAVCSDLAITALNHLQLMKKKLQNGILRTIFVVSIWL